MPDTALPAQIAPADVDRIRKSPLFDAEWYRKTYPDVAMIGMDPAEHYLKYGALLRRDPGPEFCTGFYLDTHPGGRQKTTSPLVRFHGKGGGEMAPDRRTILWAAANVAERGEHARAIALAERYLPEDLAYTAHILRANAAIARGREDDWLAHLNAYLGQFDVAPLVLEGTGALLDRFATAPLPPVTGGPLVSVIMPAFNAEGTIRAAARSILNQTWRNIELLIVDDASEDGTWAAMQEIAAGDDRVRIRRNKVNVGPYVSKNLALTEAKGEWITGHDADDWAHPTRIENQVSFLFKSDDGLVACMARMLRVKKNGEVSNFRQSSKEHLGGVLQRASISAMFNHEKFKEFLGFWDSVRFSADSEMLFRANIIFEGKIEVQDDFCMLCLDHENSLQNDPVYGITKIGGMSAPRRKYREAFKSWHNQKTLTDLCRAYVPFPLKKYRFEVPAEAAIPLGTVEEIISSGWFR